MHVIGTPGYNLLLDFIRCQVKHPNIRDVDGGGSSSVPGRDAKACVKVEKAYTACHAAVMGVGNYKGHRHCGEEMERLYMCVNPDASLP